MLNGTILAFAGERMQRLDDSVGPPGWGIGGVWTLLFAALGATRWTIRRAGDRTATDVGHALRWPTIL